MPPGGRALALALLVVGLAGGLGGGASVRAASSSLAGRLQVMEMEMPDGGSKRMLAVHTAGGVPVRVHVSDPRQLRGLRTGMHVKATGHWGKPASARASAAGLGAAASGLATLHFSASTLRATSGGPAVGKPRLEVQGGGRGGGAGSAAATPKAPAVVLSSNPLTARSISVLVIPIEGIDGASGDACSNTAPAWYTADDVRNAVFEERSPKDQTLGSTFNRCSYGRSRLTQRNSAVADLVTLPCTGESHGVPWAFSTCEFDDFSGIADAAEARLAARGVNVERYRHRVFLMPPGACNFVGMAYVGCGSSPGDSCRSWIGGPFWTSSQAMVHELAHNLWLDHAGSVGADGVFAEYNDESCAMGYCCAHRCFNTPHAWQLGWLSVQHFNSSRLRAGAILQVKLASQALTPRSGLRIVPDWANGTDRADPLFLGYRTQERGDAALSDRVAQRVSVYSAPIAGSQDARPTRFEAALAVGESWAHPTAGLVVRYVRQAPGGSAAVVTLCRPAGAETPASCAGLQDRDCNGLAGAKDPACARLAQRAPPAKPALLRRLGKGLS